MRYLLLIYAEEKAKANWTEDQWNGHMGAYMKYREDLQKSGKMLGGDALQPVSDATTVRVRDGNAVPTDGPFAETKEQLGGFYMIEAGDLDQAIEWAAQIPDANYGSIEIRPIMEFDHPGHE